MSTYRVYLDDELIVETNELAATAVYRALLLRGDLRAKRPVASIEADGIELHSAPVDGAADMVAKKLPFRQLTLNDVLKKLFIMLDLTNSDVQAAAKLAGLQLSNSKIQGWRVSSDNRKYQPVQIDELYLILVGLEKLRGATMTLTELAQDFSLKKHMFFINDGLNFETILEQLAAGNMEGFDPHQEDIDPADLAEDIIYDFKAYLTVFRAIAAGKFEDK